MTSLSCHDLSFSWPDGHRLLTGLDATFPTGLTGLIGRNGVGKSTLLRLLAGELTPTAGVVAATGSLVRLPQRTTAGGSTVAGVLGIAEEVAALARADRGAADAADLELLADRWDVADRARALLDRLGLDAPPGLERPTDALSGGEVSRLMLAAALWPDPDILLLDEPTNDLDSHHRRLVIEAIRDRRGITVVVSHDRNLLEAVDHIAELRPARRVRTFSQRTAASLSFHGGTLTDHERAVAAEQRARRGQVRDAEADLARQQADLTASQTVIDRRQRFGRKATAEKRQPKIVMNARKREAQQSAAKLREGHQRALARSVEALTTAEELIRDDATITVDLPETELAARRRVVTTTDLVLRNGRAVEVWLTGPERVAITGANGVGKTTLLHTLTGDVVPRSGRGGIHVPHRLLPQGVDLLADDESVLDAVRRYAPQADPQQLRDRLARFWLAGDQLDQSVGELSGGERFRASLAALLLATPAPQLLILDEPGNHLDLDSVTALVSALRGYRGALLITSHDERLLDDIGITRRVDM